jgi:cytochrome c-type biogenesis protein CcmH/NrfG
MVIVRNRKEKAVILFFWLMLAVVIVMTTINLTGKEAQKKPEVAAGTGQAANVQGKIAELKNFLRDNPGNIQALVSLGDLYFEGKQIREAIEVFEEAVKLDPKSVHIQNGLGGLYMQTGAFDLALQSFQKALDIDPNHLNSLFHMGMIYRYSKKDTKTALEIFERLLSKNPEPDMAKQVKDEIAKIKTELR